MLIGFYQLSNPQFFSQSSNDDALILMAREQSAFIFDWINSIFGVNQQRFYQ